MTSSVQAEAGSDSLAPSVTPAQRRIFAQLAPPTLPLPPKDPTNRYSRNEDAARLGMKLFFDPSFSGRLLEGDNDGSIYALGRRGETGRVACAGCHLPGSGFVDTRTLGQTVSLAAGWGVRKAPSLLDVAQGKLFMWDGRRDTLYNQIFGVIESPVEMNSSRLFVAQQLAREYRKEYEAVFGKMPKFDDPQQFPQLLAKKNGCFPRTGHPTPVCTGTTHGSPGDRCEYDGLSARKKDEVTRAVVNMGKAIAAYERKLTCGPGRFDRWVNGDETALTVSEKRGAMLFSGKARCIECHSGPYFSDFKFHNVGLVAKPVALIVYDARDEGAFKGLKASQSDPLNAHGKYSDGYDGRSPMKVPKEKYLGAMKTPMLRCVDRRPSFMHTGQIHSLKGVVKYFSQGGDGNGEFGRNELSALDLTEIEIDDLTGFLSSLAGPGPTQDLLRDPRSP